MVRLIVDLRELHSNSECLSLQVVNGRKIFWFLLCVYRLYFNICNMYYWEHVIVNP